MLNEICINENDLAQEWIARFTKFDAVINDDLEWLCMNKKYLTKDALNCKMTENQPIPEPLIYESGFNNNMNNILNKCENDFMVKYPLFMLYKWDLYTTFSIYSIKCK